MKRAHDHISDSYGCDSSVGLAKRIHVDASTDPVGQNHFWLPPLSSLVASIHSSSQFNTDFHPAMDYSMRRPSQQHVDPFLQSFCHAPSHTGYRPQKAHPSLPSVITYTDAVVDTIAQQSPTSPTQQVSRPVPKDSVLSTKRKMSPSRKDTSKSEEEDSSSGDDKEERSAVAFIPVPTVENPTFNFQQLQPIRILAYQVGLSRDATKSWRYRDIKRALFEKCSQDQLDLVDNDTEHMLLRQRLPHKLSLAQFCKRLMLLVFHFIVRDGREPKFWRKKTVRQDLVKKILRECEVDFYRKVNIKVAVMLHSYVAAGMTMNDALKRIEEEGNMKPE